MEHNYHRHAMLTGPGIAGSVRFVMPPTSEQSIVIAGIQANRPDVIIHMQVGERIMGDFTGPQLVGQQSESIIIAMLEIANDAVQSGRPADAFEVIKELLAKRKDGGYPSTLIRPIIVPVRQQWAFDLELCTGAPPGPVDVWLRTLLTRSIA